MPQGPKVPQDHKDPQEPQVQETLALQDHKDPQVPLDPTVPLDHKDPQEPQEQVVQCSTSVVPTT